MPIAFKGHYYGREGESLSALNIGEIEQIRRQGANEDWSIQDCQGATLDDLDPAAVAFARQEFNKKHPDLAAEVHDWDPLTFLNKAKVCVKGRITPRRSCSWEGPSRSIICRPASAHHVDAEGRTRR